MSGKKQTNKRKNKIVNADNACHLPHFLLSQVLQPIVVSHVIPSTWKFNTKGS